MPPGGDETVEMERRGKGSLGIVAAIRAVVPPGFGGESTSMTVWGVTAEKERRCGLGTVSGRRLGVEVRLGYKSIELPKWLTACALVLFASHTCERKSWS